MLPGWRKWATGRGHGGRGTLQNKLISFPRDLERSLRLRGVGHCHTEVVRGRVPTNNQVSAAAWSTLCRWEAEDEAGRATKKMCPGVAAGLWGADVGPPVARRPSQWYGQVGTLIPLERERLVALPCCGLVLSPQMPPSAQGQALWCAVFQPMRLHRALQHSPCRAQTS